MTLSLKCPKPSILIEVFTFLLQNSSVSFSISLILSVSKGASHYVRHYLYPPPVNSIKNRKKAPDPAVPELQNIL